MTYKENPKMKESGLIAAIPQNGRCPNNCPDCFFQGGRSYLNKDKDGNFVEIETNLPNMPFAIDTIGRVVRVNDGNDSNVDRNLVLESTKDYQMKFFNTSIPYDLEGFKDPVVLTINPGIMTDKIFYRLVDIPKNLMFIRVRTNCWNMNEVVRPAVQYYAVERKIPVILTFMAYYDTADKIPEEWKKFYVLRKRTLNVYYAITTAGWDLIMSYFIYEPFVYSCGKIEGEKGTTACARCGNCIREYFVTMERLRQ